jgi:hypothetical protein
MSMNAKDFGIRHGEKIAVAIAVASCGWFIYGVVTDQEIRPKNITMERINEMVIRIEDRRANAKNPELKRPPPYFDEMTARWALELPSNPYMIWLSTAIDVGPPDNDDLRLFIYNLHPPSVHAEDRIGNVELTISPPGAAAAKSGDLRVSSEPKASWHTDRKDHKVENSAEQLGALLEVKVGGGEWAPVKAKGVGAKGLVSFKDGAVKIVFETTEPWVHHAFRARTLIKATGFPLDHPVGANNEIPDQTVLVFAGDYPDEQIDWKALAAKLGQKDPDKDLAAKFLSGKSSLPGAPALKPGELLYISDNSDEMAITPTSDIRFVFIKSVEDPANPGQVGAQLEVNKLVRETKTDPKTGTETKAEKWLATPVEYKLLKKGDPLKFERAVVNPLNEHGKKEDFKFDTDFTLDQVLKDVKRIEYYEIKPKSRATGGRDKDLEVKEKAIQTEAVELDSPTGQKLTLVKLSKITKPPHPAAIVYPNFPALLYDEVVEFRKDPAAFLQSALIPTPPIEHDPGTGPLEEFRKKTGNNLLATDTKYYELADGRLVYWENVNKTLEVFKIPGSESDVKPIADTLPEPPKPAEGTPPAKAPVHSPRGTKPPAPTPPAPTPPTQGQPPGPPNATPPPTK